MNDERIRVYANHGNYVIYVGRERVNRKNMIEFEIYDNDLGNKLPSCKFVLHPDCWKKIVEFIGAEP